MQADAPDGQTRLRFRVVDSGIGIAPADVGRLFMPFVQADESVTRRFGGSGLGLAICKELVEPMGGTIEVQTRQGRGSSFSFTLGFEAAASTPRPQSPPPLAGLQLLLVEDSHAWRTLLADMLGRMGLTAQAVGSAREALAQHAAAQAGRPFDLIVVDWCLQGEQATALLRGLLHAQPALDRARIIVLSSYDPEPVKRELQALGVHQVLSKPISASRLLDALARAVANGHASAPPAPPAVPADLRGRRVLLVEDNEVNRFVACEMLALLGVDADIAEDGRIAVDKCLHGAYDAVLMDVQMPHMDGLSATRLIRQRMGEHRPPIVAMTAGASAEERQACVDAGMDGYLSKPVRMEALAECLRSLGAASGLSA